MRDWYAIGQLTLLPMLATILLHGLLLAVLVFRWQTDADARTIEAKVLPPSAINATLIDASSLKPKKSKPKPKAPPKTSPKPSKPAAQQIAKPAPAKPETPAPTVVEPKPQPKVEETPRLTPEELAAISRRELAEALDAEEAVSVAVTAEEMSASYAALIRDTVVNYWSRPPSARNGMEALLAIQLVPTGEIVSVTVIRSSGSTAFDRAAVNAVEKASSFPELRNLPSKEFEQTFRRFQLLFRPEDLRY